MSPPYVVSPLALDDIDGAAAFLAGQNRAAAERFLAVIHRLGTPVEIVRVLAWKQDLPTILQDESDRLPP